MTGWNGKEKKQRQVRTGDGEEDDAVAEGLTGER